MICLARPVWTPELRSKPVELRQSATAGPKLHHIRQLMSVVVARDFLRFISVVSLLETSARPSSIIIHKNLEALAH